MRRMRGYRRDAPRELTNKGARATASAGKALADLVWAESEKAAAPVKTAEEGASENLRVFDRPGGYGEDPSRRASLAPSRVHDPQGRRRRETGRDADDVKRENRPKRSPGAGDVACEARRTSRWTPVFARLITSPPTATRRSSSPRSSRRFSSPPRAPVGLGPSTTSSTWEAILSLPCSSRASSRLRRVSGSRCNASAKPPRPEPSPLFCATSDTIRDRWCSSIDRSDIHARGSQTLVKPTRERCVEQRAHRR